jgi:glyoxylase-like metal-dependent hydrolase (beta-lactamase superfamily II)
LRAQLVYWQDIESDAVKGFELVVPNLRFTDELTLDMGDVTIHALYLGRGHSASDIAIHVPEEKLLVAGSACGPFFPKIGDQVRLADLERSVSVFDRVLQSGVEHVVPSHSEVGDRELAQRRRDYYRDLLAGVADARRQGLGLEQTQAALGLEQRFPYMREAKAFRGTPGEAHAANVAAVWKLLQQ